MQDRFRRLIVFADALGLFPIAGAAEALKDGMPLFIALMMGVITGIVGRAKLD